MNIRLIQISLLLFIKYYILGSIYTTMGLVLGAHGLGAYIGIAYAVGGVSSLFVGMLIGEIADRFILPNTLLFFCHIVSGVALLLIPGQIEAGHAWIFLLLLGINTSFGDAMVPICSRVAFHTLKDSIRDYAISRAMGTLGWVVAGLVIGFGGVSASPVTFWIAAAASFVMSAYVLTLPGTPSSGRAGKLSLPDMIGWDALTMMRDRNFLVFVLVAVAITFPMSAYNAYLPVYLGDNQVTNVSGLMTLAQVTEIFLMFGLAYCIRRYGIRNILAAACLAWVSIFGLFAVGDRISLILIVVGILLHGFGWEFFYAAAEVYLNVRTPVELKARAQALLRTATFGFGTIVGSLLSGFFYNSLQRLHATTFGTHWPLFWGTIGFVPLLMFFPVLAYFRDDVEIRPEVENNPSLPLVTQTAP